MTADVTRDITLEPTYRAPGEARRFVAGVLSELGYRELVDDTKVMVSELVTNSLLYAPGEPISVDIWRAGPCLFLEVWDRSPKPPLCLDPGLLTEHGRGVRIVNELALRFGYAPFFGGKVVWVLLGVVQEDYLPHRMGSRSAPASVCINGGRSSGVGWPSIIDRPRLAVPRILEDSSSSNFGALCEA